MRKLLKISKNDTLDFKKKICKYLEALHIILS